MTFRQLGRSQRGLCPTPLFLFEKIKFQGGQSHDVSINNYLGQNCIANCFCIPSMGTATHVVARVWPKQ